MRYISRKTDAEIREKKRAAHRKWVDTNRDTYLAKKRAYAGRPEVLARRRFLYAHRNDPKPVAPPPITLDLWARRVGLP